MIKAEILLDSINSKNGSRLTTWILEYPRFVHSEFMTHRMFSKNAASSRAIPFEKFVEQVMTNPAMPVFWGKNQSGMQAVEELSNENNQEYDFIFNVLRGGTEVCFEGSEQEAAKYLWLQARDKAIEQATLLYKLGVHKQIINRILEPWFNIRIIMTATEMSNFFALRAHNDAQPEIAALAFLMLNAYNASRPQVLKPGEWHIPFGDKIDNEKLRDILPPPAIDYDGCESYNENVVETKRKIAIARCARVSYFNFEGKDDYAADVKLCNRLFSSTPMHLSPTEHVAMAAEKNIFVGNFKGFKQYRYFIDNQNLTDGRIK